MSLDNQGIDIGTNKLAQSYSHHVESRWQPHNNKIIWEVSIDIYTDAYQDGAKDNQRVSLSPGKVMGLMVAYCDNDGSASREHFIGSVAIEPKNGDKNLGYKDAGVFSPLTLVE